MSGEEGTGRRRVCIVAFDGCQSLDVLGPAEVLHGANTFLTAGDSAQLGYSTSLVSLGADSVRSESGVRLGTDTEIRAWLDSGDAAMDTLVVPGGQGVASVIADRAVLDGVAQLALHARRTVSVCTGAFVLAAAGLLDHRRATTHWAYCQHLAAAYPRITVDEQALFVRDGPIWTSAGVSAGIDLTLAIVAEDLGQAVASKVAKQLVVFMRRGGAQRQLSPQLALQASERVDIRELATWVAEHPGEDLSVGALASRCAMSLRNFSRLFREEIDDTPSAFVERVRVDNARRLLTCSKRSIEEVAEASGFSNAVALRRSFRRHEGCNPGEYRRRKTLPGL